METVISTANIWGLLFAEPCAKCLTFIGPFILHNSATKQVFLLFLFCSVSEETGAQKVMALSQVTQLENGRTGI